MAKHIITATAAPSSAPERIGLHWLDTVAKKEYRSYGTSSVGDWVEVGAGAGAGGSNDILYIPSSQASGSVFTINLDTVDQNYIEVQPVSNCQINLTFNVATPSFELVKRDLFILVKPGSGIAGIPQLRLNNTLKLPKGTPPDAGYELPIFGFQISIMGANDGQAIFFANYALNG